MLVPISESWQWIEYPFLLLANKIGEMKIYQARLDLTNMLIPAA